MTDLATHPTSPTTATAEQEHPSWCDPRRCTVLPDLPLNEALHLSTAIDVATPLSVLGPLAIQAWLQQAGDGGGTIYLVLDSPDIDCGRPLYPLADATATLATLTRLTSRAGTSPQSPADDRRWQAVAVDRTGHVLDMASPADAYPDCRRIVVVRGSATPITSDWDDPRLPSTHLAADLHLDLDDVDLDPTQIGAKWTGALAVAARLNTDTA